MKPLYNINRIPRKIRIGNKARSIRLLKRKAFPVPRSFIIPAEIHNKYRVDSESTLAYIREPLEKKVDPAISYAVRSSGLTEDRDDWSYAGQFKTFLNVKGYKAIIEAVVKIWESADTVDKGVYKKKISPDTNASGMAVIIQEMIRARWSGVAFSINPVTGRSEMIIEGIRGEGKKLVQEGQTPYRWIFHQGTWESYTEEDSPGKEVLGEIRLGLESLRKFYRSEIDVEWVWNGRKLYYLQCRKVTTHKYPTIYSNHISREVLPGMIKPLVWSVNIPLVNGAWLKLLRKMLGSLDITPEQLSRSFYYRTYFNMGTLGSLFQKLGLPKDSLESLMGRKDPSGKSAFKPGLKTMRYIPRIIVFLVSNMNLGSKFRKDFQELRQKTDSLIRKLKNFDRENYRSLFDLVNSVSGEVAYYNIIIPLTMQVTNRMLQRRMEKKGYDFSLLNFLEDIPLIQEYDPQYHIQILQQKWKALPEAHRDPIKSYAELNDATAEDTLNQFRQELDEFIRKFGHFSESGNDFSYIPWRENPGFVFNMIIKESKVSGAGQEKLIESKKSSLPGTMRRAYRRAGTYRLYREMISSEYTRCYGLFRKLFMKSGSYLSEKGLLKDPGDVFYLTLEEHNQLLAEESPVLARQLREKIAHTRDEMESYKDIMLPSVIYGDIPPPIPDKEHKQFRGIPTSPGIYEGKITVIRGYQDFQKEIDGNIIVIPFSDVGWTPIMVNAGAIVSESGGMLSHASIVARELSIPAIASVDHACSLKDGTKAKVDGFNGYLTIHK